jgi:hypothetical protein
MKRVALAAALLVVAGTASAAMFVPPPAPVVREKPARISAEPVMISALAKPSAPTVETKRAPVPFVRLPPPPAPQMASITEPPPDLSQIQPKPRPREADTAKSAIERGLANNGRCVGRSLTSVRVEGNGTVHVEC